MKGDEARYDMPVKEAAWLISGQFWLASAAFGSGWYPVVAVVLGTAWLGLYARSVIKRRP